MYQGAFLMRGLANVRTEFSLTALAYNLRRALNILGVEAMTAAAVAALEMVTALSADALGFRTPLRSRQEATGPNAPILQPALLAPLNAQASGFRMVLADPRAESCPAADLSPALVECQNCVWP